jgi:hypothetical protein
MKALRNALRGPLHGWRVRAGRAAWRIRGRPAEGMYFKQERCRRIGAEYGCETLVETGTFWGDMIDAMRPHYRKIHSIELYEPLFRRASHRYRHDPGVTIHHGDSAEVLPRVLEGVSGRALFWLDGHYCGEGTGLGASECPVEGELDAIAAHERRDHCILIDDARLFGLNPDYPTTEEVRLRLLRINPGYRIAVEHDCITALPPRT